MPGFKLWKQKQNTALERAADCHLEKGYFLKDARLSSKTGGETKKKKKNHVYVTSWIDSGGSVGKLYILLRVQILSLEIIYPTKGSDFVTQKKIYISY